MQIRIVNKWKGQEIYLRKLQKSGELSMQRKAVYHTHTKTKIYCRKKVQRRDCTNIWNNFFFKVWNDDKYKEFISELELDILENELRKTLLKML